MAVTHDRYFLDNVAGWILELDRGRGLPFQGNYTGWLEQKQARLAVEEKQAGAPAPHAGARARVGAHVAARPPGQVQGAPAAYERMLAEEQQVKLDTRRDPHPGRARGWATSSWRPTTCRRASATAC